MSKTNTNINTSAEKVAKINLEPAFKSFSEVLDYWAKKEPNKVFLRDLTFDKEYTYAETNKLVNKAVGLLKQQGVGHKDVVCVCIRNSAEVLILFLASMRLGSVMNVLPSTLSIDEIAKNLDFVKPSIVFLEKQNAEKISGKHKIFVVELKGKDSFVNMLTAKDFAEDVPVFCKDFNENDPACLYYTSGTTSNPKAILFGHKNLMSLIASACRGFKFFNHDMVHFCFLPMAHTSILHHCFFPVAYLGATLIFAENFMKIRTRFWGIIEEYQATYVQTVPTILFMILNTKYPDYNKEKLALKYVACGSAPLPMAVHEDFMKKFGLPIVNLYGTSETGQSHFDDPFEKGWKPGSVGVPLDVNECKIFDDNMKELPRGEVGEIATKTPNMFINYYKNDKAYKEAVKDGYFFSGDLGYQDKKGKFFFVDRKKDLIIKGGVNIVPGEIDEVLFKHPDVREVSTIGVPDRFLGEDIVSFVVLKEKTGEQDENLERELVDFCHQHLQHFKCPKKIIFLDAIPQTASGKLLRRKLRQMYDEEFK